MAGADAARGDPVARRFLWRSTNMTDLPKCPLCRTGKHAVPHGSTEFYCKKCGGLYDENPNEGGSAYNDPTKRLEVMEERSNRGRSRRDK